MAVFRVACAVLVPVRAVGQVDGQVGSQALDSNGARFEVVFLTDYLGLGTWNQGPDSEFVVLVWRLLFPVRTTEISVWEVSGQLWNLYDVCGLSR